MKYDLIYKIYGIFINKLQYIKGNYNKINLCLINTNDIENKIDNLQNEFYSYEPSKIQKVTKTDNIGKLSQDIETIIQDISKTEEGRKKKKKMKMY